MRWIITIAVASIVLLNACVDTSEIPTIKDPTMTRRPAEIGDKCSVYEAALASEPYKPSDVQGPASICGSLSAGEVPSLDTPAKRRSGEPKTSVSLSEIDFDQDFTNARLILSWYCGGQFGGAKEINLIKKDGRWMKFYDLEALSSSSVVGRR
jgi:hypothetical protein